MRSHCRLFVLLVITLFFNGVGVCQKIGGWFTTDSLHDKKQNHAGIQLNDGNILVTGGYTPFQYLPINETEIYDVKSQKWKVAVPINKGRAYHNLIKLKDGSILAIGGFSERTCEILNNDYTKWAFTDSLNTRKYYGQNAVLLQDGNVLVIGGYINTPNDTTGALNECEIYNYSEHNWELTSKLNTGRFEHSATLLNNGRVLVTGGRTIHHGEILLNSCEIFDPVTQEWTYVAPMHYSRAGHSATLLLNGKVLVIGGQQNISELYNPMTGNWEIVGKVTLATGINKAITIADEKYLILISGVDDYILRNGWELYSLEKYESIYYERFSRIIWNQVVLKIDNNRILVAGGEEGILSGGDPVLTSTDLCQIFDINLTSVEEEIIKKSDSSPFLTCYPNPYNNSTNINIVINKQSFITLTLYNALGQKIEEIFEGYLSEGIHNIHYESKNVSSGFYIVSLKCESNITAVKLIYQK